MRSRLESDLARDTLQQVIDTNKRIAEVSLRTADEAAQLSSRLKATPIRVAAPRNPHTLPAEDFEARPSAAA